jgi:hypothetical protein
MWDEEQDFDIMDEGQEYDFNDENAEDLLYSELGPAAEEDEDDDSDLFDYEAGFYLDEEDE